MKNSPFILYVCIFITMMGFGITLPVLPFYIERMAISNNVSQQSISFHIGSLTGIFALMQFIFAPLWGKLSDHLGKRRPIFLICLFGASFFLFLFGISEGLVSLYISRIFHGIFAAAIIPLSAAYITDMTSGEKRISGITWLGTATGLGIFAGPALGGFLSQMDLHFTSQLGHFNIDNFSTPFFAASLITIISLAIAIITLPEPKTVKESTEKSKEKIIDQNQSTVTNRKWINTEMGRLLALSFLAYFALALFEGTFALHAQQVMNFSATQMGFVFMVCGFVMAAAQGTVVARFIKQFGEKKLLSPGFATMGIGLLLLMTTENIYIILIYVAIFAFGMAILAPSLILLITKTQKGSFGTSLGLQGSANSLGQAGGPFIGGVLIVYNVHMPYILTAGALTGATVLLLIRSLKKTNGQAKDTD